jgi:hypothetical protein
MRDSFPCTFAAIAVAGSLWAACSMSRADAPPSTRPAQVPAAATAPAGAGDAPASVDVDALVKRLGSDSEEDRDAAQRQLVDLGPAVVPTLRKASAGDADPEVRSRAAGAVAQIADRTLRQASILTLHVKGAPEQDVLDAIGRQANARLQGDGRPAGRPGSVLTIDADRKPFWDVMGDVCDQMNVCPTTLGPGSYRLNRTGRNWFTGAPHQVVGPYWIGVANIGRDRAINLMGPPRVSDHFVVSVVVLPEPKLSVFQVSDFHLTEAKDDMGNSLLPDRTAGQHVRLDFHDKYQRDHLVAEAPLAYPERPGTKIAVLRGEVAVVLAQQTQACVVDDVLGTPRITPAPGAAKVQATITRRGPALYHVEVRANKAGLTDEQFARSVIRLADAAGRPLAPITDPTLLGASGGSNQASVWVDGMFTSTGGIPSDSDPIATPAAGEPARLTWTIPTSMKYVVLPVTFKDLPMP